MTRSWPRTAVLPVLLTTLLTGACTVSSPPAPAPDTSRGAVEQFRRDREVRYDLTRPRTAQELGVREGSDSAIFDRDDAEYWDVTFALPQDRAFSTSAAIAVGVFIGDPVVPGGLLNEVGVNAQARDLDDLAGQLTVAAQQLGLDQAAMDDFIARERRQPPTTTSPEHHRVFTSPPIGHLTATAEPRISQGRDYIAINYSFTWEPGPGAEG